jgi:hypothetical protein
MYFVVIPSSVYLNKKISSDAKICYGLILGLSNVYGYSYANNEYLSAQLDVSIRSVQRYLSELKSEGLLKLEFSQNKARKMYPIVKALPNEKQGLKSLKNKGFEGPDELSAEKYDMIQRLLRGAV